MSFSQTRILTLLSFAFFWSTTSHAVVVRNITVVNESKSVTVGKYPSASTGVINLGTLSADKLNVTAAVDAVTKSVRWKLDNQAPRISNQNPFKFCVSGSCAPWGAGRHTLEVQPFRKINATGKAGAKVVFTFNITQTVTPSPTPSNTAGCSAGLWVWNGREVLASTAEQDLLIAQAKSAKLSDLYIYLVTSDYSSKQASIQAFIRKLTAAGLKAWGLEGYRGYFADSYGPAGYYAAMDELIAYNARVGATERFIGFQADLEPQDGQGSEFLNTFHNDIPDSRLSTTGGGVWYATQRQDRDALMQNWLQIYRTSNQRLYSAGLKFSAAMPSWVDDYYGEPIQVTYNGVRQNLLPLIMAEVDNYLIMSYSTDPVRVIDKVKGELAAANAMPLHLRPLVSAGLETHTGVGSGISYGDTVGKNTKTVVLKDIQTLKTNLGSNPSFCEVNIHDWVGWKNLKP